MFCVSQNLGPKPSFLNIFQKFLQKWTQRTLFYTILIPMTSHAKTFDFVHRGALRGPRNLKKKLWYPKIISTRGCKKIFLIRAKKNLYWVSQNLGPKPSFLNIFQKTPSEMNSKHPFYSILIPMTSHAKIFILFVGGPQGVPEP